MAENDELIKSINALKAKVDQLSLQLRSAGQDIPREIDSYHYLYKQLNPITRIRPAGAWAAPYESIARLVEIVLGRAGGINIVELGGGISTLWLGYAIRKVGKGKIYSIEHDKGFLDISHAQIKTHDLDNWVNLIYAPISLQKVNEVQQRWYTLNASDFNEVEIDLLVVDGPPGATDNFARWPAYPYFAPQLRDGALVLLDDVDREVEWNIGVRWTTEYNDSGKLTLIERLGRSSLYKFETKK